MSAIDDLSKAKAATYGGVWTWEPHGDGWALYVDRGEPIIPELPRGIGNQQHGYNILSVDRDGFDAHGEPLRAFILEAGMKVPLLAEERDAERKAWVRLLKASILETIRENSDFSEATDHEKWRRARAESLAARQALCDLGVDVDALLGESTGEDESDIWQSDAIPYCKVCHKTHGAVRGEKMCGGPGSWIPDGGP